jgi:hypothetical protein
MSSPETNDASAPLEREDWLDRLLHEGLPTTLSDDGFSVRVMQRVSDLRVCEPAPVIAADVALDRLQRTWQAARRRVRWSVGGALVGFGVAAFASFGGRGLGALADPAPQSIWAMVLASLVVLTLVFRHERD